MMTNQQKAEKYDALVREGHNIQHEISKVKSDMITNSGAENTNKMQFLVNKLNSIERETHKLMSI